MTKTLRYEIENCGMCPFLVCRGNNWGTNSKVCFCSHTTIGTDRAVKLKMPLLPPYDDKTVTYVYVGNLNTIPDWCPL
jgi:hypothetical protein